MKNKLSIFIFALFLMLSFGSVEQVLACWCRSQPICVLANNASAIFTGKVLKITNNENLPDGEISFSPKQTILFQIKENFSGEKYPETIEIQTGGEWDCDYFSFKQDSEYLVFAYKTEQGFHTGLCGGTKWISKAGEDIEYLRKLPNGNENGKIMGSVYGVEFDKTLNRYVGTFSPNSSFMLSGNGINKTILADNSGFFEISNLKAGNYRLQAFMPSYYDFFEDGKDESVREIKLNGRGCSSESFFPKIKNTLEGKVTDKKGKPLKDIEVNLVPKDKFGEDDSEYEYSAWTDINGNFIFTDIFPRRYNLGINIEEDDEDEIKIYHPNTQKSSKATIIEFGLSETLKGYNLIWHRSKK